MLKNNKVMQQNLTSYFNMARLLKIKYWQIGIVMDNQRKKILFNSIKTQKSDAEPSLTTMKWHHKMFLI